VVKAIDAGWFQRQIAASSMRYVNEVETGRRVVVGVNEFVESDEQPVDILRIGSAAETRQRERLAQLRATRNSTAADAAIEALAAAAREDRNVIPAMLDCARAYCTLHEIRQTLEQIYGSYREPVFF
jgi:methylmalonyl-CoA mutase N-terminal domain/subunit